MLKNYFKAAFVVGVLMMLMKSSSLPRGIRNNNPGNIRANSLLWDGQTGIDELGFAMFETPEHGLRALFRVLDTYRTRYGLVTIEGIISRWAPPSENNTSAYINHASQAVGVAPDVPLSPEHYLILAQTIVKHENGQQPYNEAQYLAGAEMAGGYDGAFV